MGEQRPMITEDISGLAFKFLECLFDGDVDGYWEMISKVDKARLYGMYVASDARKLGITFRGYIRDTIFPDHAANYENLKGNSPGISMTLRYTEEGEALVYLFEGVHEPRIYEEETLVHTFPITLTVDSEYDFGEVKASWKVRAYSDKLYDKI